MKKIKSTDPMVIAVPYEFLDWAAEQNCCDTLDMFTPAKSRGIVIEFGGVLWVCTGSCSQYHHYKYADLHRCVPAAEYQGPPHHHDGTPETYYPGGQLKDRKGNVWIMTDEEIRLVPEEGN